jgi:alpha-galactosidase
MSPLGGNTVSADTVRIADGQNLPASAEWPTAISPTGRLALTPPMGWNGFNHFYHNVTEATVEAEARALVLSGMQAAGYTYVNLDGGWDLKHRNAAGELQPDPAKFPHGLKPVADYVHALGLKFGIYASAGYTNCAATSAGSYGHYLQDAAAFAAWGVDYVKFDWCYIPFRDYPHASHQQVSQLLAREMAGALAGTNRSVFYDINDWMNDDVWIWARGIAHMWRTTHDSHDWCTTEYQAQFSLWAEMAAPLIAGNDLTRMSPVTRSILTNADVIAVDQDPLGRQGYPVSSEGGHWVLTRPLVNGDRAVVLFNETGKPAFISTTVQQVGAINAPQWVKLNLWDGTVTQTGGPIAALVPPHGVVMYVISGLRPVGI